MSLILTICHDGDTACEQTITHSRQVRTAMAAHRPPQARGSVAVITHTDLPLRHPHRKTIIATSVHGRTGPAWCPASPEFAAFVIDPKGP